MHVYVLGDPHLRIDGRVHPFPAGRPGRLLASLLAARGRVVTDDRLVDDVWGEDLPLDARAALHTTVGRTRRALGREGTRIGRTAVGYRLDLTGVDLDADRFATALARARALEDGGRLAAYDEALGLWRGTPWAGLAVDSARGEALRLEDAYVAAREERAEVLVALGRLREAADELRQLTAEHPLRDQPSLLLMRALHRLGASADALAVYAAHRQALAEELGLDPSPELAEAQRDILERTPDPAPSSVSTPATTREPTTPPTATLPDLDPTKRLIGRHDDIEQVRALTARHQCVTVVGPGGVGKTSVARAVAAGQVAWWADLTSVSTQAGVRAVVATALGVEVFPGGSAEAALHRRLETATGLLVLDNCEHVLATVGDLTTGIASLGAGVRVLATSRERLGIPVEQVYPLSPLRLPGAGAVDADVPSVALFLERAQASAPDLEATPDVVRDVAELVRRLDGLPLAIELAASRVGVVSLATLRDRLDDRLDLLRSHHRRGPARHQTLVDTIDWSYDLLDEDQRRALRWLSVFSGPFDLDAAEAVLGPDSTEQVLGLVERSLLVRPAAAQGGYRMLETVRAYARALLDDGERTEVGLAHAKWAADVTAAARVGMAGRDAGWWSGRVEALLPELARAVSWALETGRVEEAARIVPDLFPWAESRVRADVMRWGWRLVESGHAGALTPAVLAVASSYSWMVGDHERAAEYSDRGIDLAGGPEAPAAYLALNAAADTALAVGDLDKAWEASEHAMRHAMKAGDWNATVLCVSGMLLARTYGERAVSDEIALLRAYESRVDNPMIRAMALYAEAEAVSADDPQHALQLFADARELARRTGNRLVLGVAMVAETALLGRVGALDAETVNRTADAVRFWLDSGNENLFVTCLRNVVSLLDRLDAHRAVVELVATTTTRTPDRPPYGVEAEGLGAAMARAREALTPAELDAAWREGAARDLDSAGQVVVTLLSTQPTAPARSRAH
ncbi:MAG TPA: BTAD domain-containing putative transcriptional regulator [Nocardioides sp.]|nr:BTAD domain-containing putative transcriptional regulator [Nocardioides sp.]